MSTDIISPDLELLDKLNKDIRQVARGMKAREARYIVDLYYQIQEHRKAVGNQIAASTDQGEPNRLLAWFSNQLQKLENNVKRSLDEFTDEYLVGRWMKSITGIGPVISAGMLTHLDIRRAPTAGHFWRFAGYDPSREWLGRERARELVKDVCASLPSTTNKMTLVQLQEIARHTNTRWENLVEKLGGHTPKAEEVISLLAKCPWNAKLKTLCFKAGDCFIKQSGRSSDYYGAIYFSRKSYEEANNAAKKYAGQAKDALFRKNYGKETEARKAYEDDRLPQARIHMRALRYSVKMFLSHLHHVEYVDYYGKEPPAPFALDHMPGHSHFVPIPNWPWTGGGRSLRDLYEE